MCLVITRAGGGGACVYLSGTRGSVKEFHLGEIIRIRNPAWSHPPKMRKTHFPGIPFLGGNHCFVPIFIEMKRCCSVEMCVHYCSSEAFFEFA